MDFENVFVRLAGVCFIAVGLGMLMISVEGFFNPNASITVLFGTPIAKIGASIIGTGFAVFFIFIGIEVALDRI